MRSTASSRREAYSAGRYAVDAAARMLEACARAGRRPIIVGGTGLYFKALLEGLRRCPPMPASARPLASAKRRRGAGASCTPCWRARDPQMAARLMPTDPQRDRARAGGAGAPACRSPTGSGSRASRCCEAETVPPRRLADARGAHAAHRCALRGMMEAKARWMRCARLRRSGSTRAADHAALGVRRWRHLAGELALRGGDAAGQDRDPAVRQTAADVARGNMIAWRWLSSQEMERFRRRFLLIY